MSARADRRLALAFGGLLALLFTAWAAFGIAGWSVGSATRTEHRELPAGLRVLHLDVGGGDVSVTPTDGDRVVVDSRVSGTLHRPSLVIDARGDTVRVHGGCRAFGFGRCKAEIAVQVPAETSVDLAAESGDVRVSGLSMPVQVQASSGDVQLDGLSGGADVRLASGDVTANRLDGPVSLESASGDVVAQGLRGPTLRVQAASGDVVAGFSRAPERVDVSSASGDVTVRLPRSSAAPYRVSAQTDSGDRTVSVRTDPAAERTIRAHSDSGDVVVGYGP